MANARQMGWVGQFLIAVVPAVVTAYVSYAVAVLQAQGNTKERTDASYETLLDVVKTLQQAIDSNHKDVEALQAYVKELQERVSPPGRPRVEQPTLQFDPKKLWKALPQDLDHALALQRATRIPS
jgi:uncharacterized protein YlxW (UPF0749 family)